jgi:hypothetical protein
MSTAAARTSARPKVGLVRLPLDSIRPAPENDRIYRPVSPGDPEIRALARSIREHGLREPIVVTEDGYILSGHRRHAACRLAGLRQVDCRVEPITRFHPDFETLLVEYNRQRVKGFDEVLREQVIAHNPEDAYRALVEHRRAKAGVSGDFIQIGGEKRRKRISNAKRPMLEAIARIVYEQRQYWPLSDRSIHYDLLNAPPLRHAGKPDSRYQNNRDCYKDACDLLTRARLAGEIPFAAVADPTRTVCNWELDDQVGGFIRRQLDGFLEGYFRNLQQSQPNHIEIIGEKNTIEASIRDVAMEFCIPYTLGRGYCSLDPRYKMCQRFRASGKEKLVILILSDFDPEGEDIAYSFARSMRDDFGVEIVAQKVCLTHDQVVARDLPQTFDIKKKSARYKKFAAKYGDRAHELEALAPAERSRLLTEAIEGVLDVDAYNREIDAEAEDAARIDVVRGRALEALAGILEGDDQ